MKDILKDISVLKEDILNYERNSTDQTFYRQIDSIPLYNTSAFEVSQCFISDNLDTIPSVLVRVLVIVLYSATATLSLLGNVVVIVVQLAFYRSPPLQNIRKYLINLALSDIVFGVLCVPFVSTDFIMGKWIFPNWLCPVTHYAQLLSVFVTSNTLMIIGLERYSAIFFPLSNMQHFLRSKSYILLAFIWLLGCVYAYFLIYDANADLQEEKASKNNETVTNLYYQCNNYIGHTLLETKYLISINFVFTFVIPLIVIVFTYTAIVQKLTHINRSMIERKYTFNKVVTFDETFSPPKEQEKLRSTARRYATRSISVQSFCTRRNRFAHHKGLSRYKKSIHITLLIIVLYGICWSPIKVFQLLHQFQLILYCTSQQYHVQLYLYIALHWLAMANSFVNPIVHTFASQRFRSDSRKILKFMKLVK